MKRNHNLRRPVLLVFTVLQLAATTGLRAQQPDYFPVPAKGSSRESSLEIKNEATADTQRGILTRAIEDEVEMKGEKYLKVVSNVTGIPDIPEDVEYRRTAADGIYVIEGDAISQPEHREILLPIAVGQEWTYENAEGKVHAKAEAIEDLKLADRTIKDCLKISESLTRSDDVMVTSQTWFAPGVGEVKVLMQRPGTTIEILFIKTVPAK